MEAMTVSTRTGAEAHMGSALGPSRSAESLGLSARQTEILSLMAQGQEIDAISAELLYSTSTIKKEIHRLMRQLGARNRTQAVAMAIRAGAL